MVHYLSQHRQARMENRPGDREAAMQEVARRVAAIIEGWMAVEFLRLAVLVIALGFKGVGRFRALVAIDKQLLMR